MEVIPASQRLSLLTFMQSLKQGLENWLIVELKLTNTVQEEISIAAVAKLLGGEFVAFNGRILICTPSEALMLIEWGKDKTAGQLAKKIGTTLPPNVCETTVLLPNQGAIKKFELFLSSVEDFGQMYRDRLARNETIFLVADDDPYMRLLVKQGLKEFGSVIEVAEGDRVAEVYKEFNPDMVLLDIHMPGLSGKDALTSVQELDPEAYIVMLSADSSAQNVQLARKNGAKGFLAKPFSKTKLLEYVDICPTAK
jgi:two-component system chemotaxis response regulator CheY